MIASISLSPNDVRRFSARPQQQRPKAHGSKWRPDAHAVKFGRVVQRDFAEMVLSPRSLGIRLHNGHPHHPHGMPRALRADSELRAES